MGVTRFGNDSYATILTSIYNNFYPSPNTCCQLNLLQDHTH